MTNTLVTLKSSYSAAFEAYLTNKSEEALHAAYELGRAAVAARVNMLDLSGTHHDVLLSVLRQTSPEDIEFVTEAAASFFLQTLSAFEMVQRGFHEAQETVLLEKQHAAQLQQLSKASVAINSRRSLQETLQSATERGGVKGDSGAGRELSPEDERSRARGGRDLESAPSLPSGRAAPQELACGPLEGAAGFDHRLHSVVRQTGRRILREG